MHTVDVRVHISNKLNMPSGQFTAHCLGEQHEYQMSVSHGVCGAWSDQDEFRIVFYVYDGASIVYMMSMMWKCFHLRRQCLAFWDIDNRHGSFFIRGCTLPLLIVYANPIFTTVGVKRPRTSPQFTSAGLSNAVSDTGPLAEYPIIFTKRACIAVTGFLIKVSCVAAKFSSAEISNHSLPTENTTIMTSMPGNRTPLRVENSDTSGDTIDTNNIFTSWARLCVSTM